MEEKNNAKYKQFGIVVNAKKESPNPTTELEQLQRQLLKSGFFVASIIHDKDITEQGEQKQVHLHAYIETPQKHTKKQLLSLVVAVLQVEANQVSIQGDNNGFLLVQYLTHKNDQAKHQYPVEKVKTNNIELFGYKYNQKYTDPEARAMYLIADIKACRTLSELMDRQGLETANRYRAYFNQIKQEQQVDLDSILTRYRQLQKVLSELVETIRNYPNMKPEVKAFQQELIEVLKKYGDFNFLTSL